MLLIRTTALWVAIFVSLGLSGARVANAQDEGEDSATVASQNPSPMVDHTRKHGRITQTDFNGISYELNTILPKPVDIFVPLRFEKLRKIDLLIHFLGSSNVVKYAAQEFPRSIVVVTVNLGMGSKVYGDVFKDSTAFPVLLKSVIKSVEQKLKHPIVIRGIVLSGFSAGYGAVRQIIAVKSNLAKVDAVLLLDGIHASYIPDRKVLSKGGKIDSTQLEPFLELAREASKPNSHMKFLITHSEIFPGTFASTTETTDYILERLGIKIEPVLKWGPLGMQELSIARKNRFEVLGFAGNTAPDHIDHLEALFYFLKKVVRL